MEVRRNPKKLAAFLLLYPGLLAPPVAEALTLSQIRTEARVLALDNGSVRKRFSDARVNAFINEGHRQSVVEARPILKSTGFELAVGTTYYALASDFLQMHRLTHDWEVLPETTPEALDRYLRWQETASEPTHYFIHFATRSFVGFYPYPNSSSSTGTIRYEYWAQAQDMSSDSTEPYNGVEELVPYHYGLAYFAAARMAAIDGRVALAQFYLTEYRAVIERMKSEAKSRPSYRPGASPSITGPRGPG